MGLSCGVLVSDQVFSFALYPPSVTRFVFVFFDRYSHRDEKHEFRSFPATPLSLSTRFLHTYRVYQSSEKNGRICRRRKGPSCRKKTNWLQQRSMSTTALAFMRGTYDVPGFIQSPHICYIIYAIHVMVVNAGNTDQESQTGCSYPRYPTHLHRHLFSPFFLVLPWVV